MTETDGFRGENEDAICVGGPHDGLHLTLPAVGNSIQFAGEVEKGYHSDFYRVTDQFMDGRRVLVYSGPLQDVTGSA